MHPGGFVGGPAGRRRGFAAPSWPRSSPAWGPAPCSGGGPQTLHCVRAWGRGRIVPRCRALGRWGPAPRPLFRHFAPGGALGPLGRWGPGFRRGLGRARPLRRGGPSPPWLARASRSSRAAGSLAGDRSPLLAAPVPPGLRGGPPCSPLSRGGPVARLGPPLARCFPPPLHRRGARAGCGPRLWGALRPPPGIRVCRAGLLCAVPPCFSAVPAAMGAAGAAPAARWCGRQTVYRRCRGWEERTERERPRRYHYRPPWAGSVRFQLRCRKGNSLPQIGQYRQYSRTG